MLPLYPGYLKSLLDSAVLILHWIDPAVAIRAHAPISRSDQYYEPPRCSAKTPCCANQSYCAVLTSPPHHIGPDATGCIAVPNVKITQGIPLLTVWTRSVGRLRHPGADTHIAVHDNQSCANSCSRSDTYGVGRAYPDVACAAG